MRASLYVDWARRRGLEVHAGAGAEGRPVSDARAKIVALVPKTKTPLVEQGDQLEKFMNRVLDAGFAVILMAGMHEDGRVEFFDTAGGAADLAIMHRRLGHLVDDALDGPDAGP
jgi:hypothetical protein